MWDTTSALTLQTLKGLLQGEQALQEASSPFIPDWVTRTLCMGWTGWNEPEGSEGKRSCKQHGEWGRRVMMAPGRVCKEGMTPEPLTIAWAIAPLLLRAAGLFWCEVPWFSGCCECSCTCPFPKAPVGAGKADGWLGLECWLWVLLQGRCGCSGAGLLRLAEPKTSPSASQEA